MQFLCLQYTWALDDNFKGIFVYFVMSTNIRSAVAVADAADLLIFFFFWFFNNFGVQELSWSQRPAVINQDPWSHNIEYPYQYIFVILKK